MYNLLKVCISENIFWFNIVEQNQIARESIATPDFENEIKATLSIITLNYDTYNKFVQNVTIKDHEVSTDDGRLTCVTHKHLRSIVFTLKPSMALERNEKEKMITFLWAICILANNNEHNEKVRSRETRFFLLSF